MLIIVMFTFKHINIFYTNLQFTVKKMVVLFLNIVNKLMYYHRTILKA